MELVEARRLVVKLLRRHGLRGWTYATNKRKRTLGLCFSKLKRIELSVNFVSHNPQPVVLETILHEIAHAIVGTEHGHDDVWKEMARHVGASPSRTTKNVTMPHGKWQATCGGCGHLFSRHRRPKYLDGNSCRRCGPELGQLFYRHIGEYTPVQSKPAVRSVPAADTLAVAAHVPAKKGKGRRSTRVSK
jgi:predicted SprT family Zn-dependent metalloprotease